MAMEVNSPSSKPHVDFPELGGEICGAEFGLLLKL
jgi:hypothetical protein